MSSFTDIFNFDKFTFLIVSETANSLMLFALSFFITSAKDPIMKCEKCKNRVGKLFNMTQKIPDITEDAKKYCKGNKKCEKIVKKFGEKVYEGMKDLMPEQTCADVSDCPEVPEPLSKPARKAPRAALHEFENDCDYCKALFDYMTEEGLQTVTVEVLDKLVKSVCDNLPPAQVICEQITTHHVVKLVMLITSKFENQELCQAAGFCE